MTRPLHLRAGDEFDAAFARRAPGFSLRVEEAADFGYLQSLFVACSPLRETLPPALLTQQAQLQDAHFRQAFPLAMRRIIGKESEPLGRIVVDWSAPGLSHGVDIAVHPAHRAGAAGLHMLRAWIETADALGAPCRLTVRADNPARRIYQRLGFLEISSMAPTAPFVAMTRPVRRGGSR